MVDLAMVLIANQGCLRSQCNANYKFQLGDKEGQLDFAFLVLHATLLAGILRYALSV